MTGEKDLKTLTTSLGYLMKEIDKVMIGQKEIIQQVLICLLCDGNALLESNPGLGKTTLVKTIAQALDLKFSRIQGTPDLMPSDVTGTYIIQEEKGKKTFAFQRGPIFANVILFDEINRATPRTQAALLEAMQERQVTLGIRTFSLERPFFVLATQNPIDLEGTFSLPEAQTDRFLLKINLDYPDPKEEFQIVQRFTSQIPPTEVKAVLKSEDLAKIQKLVREVPIVSDLQEKVVDTVNKTRNHKYIQFGASPRAAISLVLASKAHALLNGRNYVGEEDIRKMAFPVLRHRIILNFEAEKENLTEDDVIREILGDEKKK